MGVLERDPGTTAAVLEKWLSSVAGVADPVVGDVSIPASTGWSNETILCDATWEGRTHELVVRVAPSQYQVFPDETFVRQYRVMEALARTEVPVAPVHWLDEDPAWFGRPFWIMDRIVGDIPSDNPPYAGAGWLHDATPAQQEQAWWAGVEAMAAVHTVDLAAVAAAFDVVDDTVGRHLDDVERYLAWAEEGTPHGLARRALHRLRATAPAEPAEGVALSWGDARFSNLIYREFAVVAVLDWEMASIGDPLLDLGWWLFADRALTEGSGCTRLPGFPSAEATTARWSSLTGRSADALGWYELYGAVHFTVIMLRMGRLLHEIGFVGPDFAADNLISQALGRLLESQEA